ncbi:MAG TPA: tetratricopeptide repeat protein [Opitutaceae bacterium]|nr:tetratricopeptide repeat protein [Opitutaceae bacterium]
MTRLPLLLIAALICGARLNASSPDSSAHAPAKEAEAHGHPSVEKSTAAESAPESKSHATATPEPTHASSDHAPSTKSEAAGSHEVGAEEIQSLLRIGETKTAQGDFDSAEIAYRQVLAAKATPAQDRDALLGMARMYRRKNQFTRAAAVYEKILKEFPADPQLPVVFLELGRTQRALGAYRLAITRFYSVINSTLKLPDEGTDLYRQLARTAQFEVAETYFVAGQYEEAAQYFSRLKLLDLTPDDQAKAHFKSAYALYMGGDYEKATTSLRAFLELHSKKSDAPEARYLLSLSLRRLGRNQESLTAALDLLKAEQARTSEDPKRWAYWQRKTGNQLANEFYEQGDSTSALAIYLSLAKLSEEPLWRLPVLYQIGLCYERLRSEKQAREFFETVARESKVQASQAQPRPEFAELASMANWRLQHLDWEASTDHQINTFFQQKTPAAEPTRTVSTEVPAPQP